MGIIDDAIAAGRSTVEELIAAGQGAGSQLQRQGQQLGPRVQQLQSTDPIPWHLFDAPLAGDPEPEALTQARHLVDKVTFGPTPGLVEEVADTGPATWLAQQLDPQSIPDPEPETTLLTFPSLRLDPALRRAYQFTPNEVAEDLQLATLVRAVRSTRQLQEMMVALWQDHFNTFVHDDLVAVVKASADEEIRTLALGTFEDLLLAVTRSPAMLIYLDNHVSAIPHPNENLGRELLELHTVGVEAGYTEADILDCARAITGWTVNNGTLRFEFNPDWHHTGKLRVMEWKHAGMTGPEAIAQGESLLRFLAHHHATAARVCRKIAVRFVGDTPSPALIDDLMASYRASGTSITAVLETLFAHEEFWASSGQKVKRPFELLAGSLRALLPNFAPWGGHLNTPAQSTNQALRSMGHAQFEWLAPNGYPDAGDYWTGAGTLLTRWNAILALATNQLQGITINALGIRDEVAADDVMHLVAMLGPRLIGRPLSASDVEDLVAFSGVSLTDPPETIPEPRLRHIMALVLAIPAFQVR